MTWHSFLFWSLFVLAEFLILFDHHLHNIRSFIKIPFLPNQNELESNKASTLLYSKLQFHTHQLKQGLQKAVSRLPHQILSKKAEGMQNSRMLQNAAWRASWLFPKTTIAKPLFRNAIVTRDPEFMELERQLKELTRHTERLQADAETYRDGVAGNTSVTEILK